MAIPSSVETGLVPPLPPHRSGLRWLIAIVAGLATAVGALFWTPQLLCGAHPASLHDPAGAAYSSCIEGGFLVGGLAGLLLGAMVVFLLLRLLRDL